MKRSSANLVWDGANRLGESPVWDPARQELLWSDIEGRILYRLAHEADEPHAVELTDPLASFGVTDAGELICAFDRGLGYLDRETAEIEWLGDIESDDDRTRCNDGRADRHGSFVFGTMVTDQADQGSASASDDRASTPAEPTPAGVDLSRRFGAFYQWNAGRGVTPLYRSARTANGLCFSPDGLRIYYADSAKETMWSARYHPQHALLIEDEVFVAPGVLPGVPDGSTVDIAGTIWNARYGAGLIIGLDPHGRAIAEIEVPVATVTSCVFGGPDLDVLYITTAADNGTQSGAGALFAVCPGTQGIADTPVATGRLPR